MAEYFRDSGFEKVALISGNSSAGLVTPNPDQNKNIYLLGVTCTGSPTTLREGSATGPVIIYVAQGNFNFPSTIKVPNNSGVYSTAGGVSAFYYVE